MAKRKGVSPPPAGKPGESIQSVSPWGVRLVRGERFRLRKADGGATRSRQLRDPFQSWYGSHGIIPPPIDPAVLLDLAEDNPVHGACLQAKSVDTAGRGWSWQPVNQDPDAKVIADLDARLAALSPEYTFDELLIQAAWEREAMGYAAWEVTRDEAGQIAALYPLPAWSIRVTKDPTRWVQEHTGRLVYFVAFGATEEAVDPETGEEMPGLDAEARASEILVFRAYSARTPWYGVPAWWSGTGPIAELTAIREFNVSYFKSGGQTDYNVHVTADDSEVAKQLADEIEESLNQSQGLQHTKLVTSGTKDVGVATTQMNPQTGREGHFRLRRGDLVNEVLMSHHVPPYRVGWAVLGGLGGSASTDMLNAYRFGAIRPGQRILEHKLRTTLFGPQGLDVQGYLFTLADLTLDDLAQEQQLAQVGISHGMLTPNEGRAAMRLPSVGDDPRMDERYMSSTLVPLGTVPAPAAFAAPGPDKLAAAADRLVAAGFEPEDVVNAMGLPRMRRQLPAAPAPAPGAPVDTTALVAYLHQAVEHAMDGPVLLEKAAEGGPDPAALALAERLEAMGQALLQATAALERERVERAALPAPAPAPAPAPVMEARLIKGADGRTERIEGRRADGTLAWVKLVERAADGTVTGTLEVTA